MAYLHDNDHPSSNSTTGVPAEGESQPLLPCPFCGRAPMLKEVPFSKDVLANIPEPSSYWWIGCEIDAHITGCGIGHSNVDKAVAIAKWNTRSDSPTAALAEALEAILECHSLKTRVQARTALTNTRTNPINTTLRHTAAGNLAFLLSVIRSGESLHPDEEASVREVIDHLELGTTL